MGLSSARAPDECTTGSCQLQVDKYRIGHVFGFPPGTGHHGRDRFPEVVDPVNGEQRLSRSEVVGSMEDWFDGPNPSQIV